MQQIIEFFIRHKNFLLFLALFSLGISLTQKAHSGLYTRNIASTNKVAGTLFTWLSDTRSYLALREQNEALMTSNKRLLTLINEQRQNDTDTLLPNFEGIQTSAKPEDSAQIQISGLKIIQAHVINNTYHRRKNTLTIDKGSKDGVGQSPRNCWHHNSCFRTLFNSSIDPQHGQSNCCYKSKLRSFWQFNLGWSTAR